MKTIGRAEWERRARAHAARVDVYLDPHLARRREGIRHPVFDFLFTYYSFRPAQLRRWHPGVGVGLLDATEHAALKGYRTEPGPEGAVTTLDPAYVGGRSTLLRDTLRLLTATAGRPAQFGCFGLHEWAMVYRGGDDALRHDVPLRLGHAGTDRVVEDMPLRCTHYDAFRFFTPDAVPRNDTELSPDHRLRTEQPGCLHAAMDLYKWVAKLGPLLSSDLLLDCFDLARTAREIDMRASPYDLREYGYAPIAVETPAGRAEYVRAQQDVAERATGLRARVIDGCRTLLVHSGVNTSG